MSDRVDEIEQAICEDRIERSAVFTQMKQIIQRLESELESQSEAYGLLALKADDLRRKLDTSRMAEMQALNENAELRREVSELNRALIAMAKYSDWALVVSDDEEQLISTLLERAEKGDR